MKRRPPIAVDALAEARLIFSTNKSGAQRAIMEKRKEAQEVQHASGRKEEFNELAIAEETRRRSGEKQEWHPATGEHELA